MLKNKLMQLFRDNPGKPVQVKAEVEEKEATVYLYEPIGGWYGVEAIDFVKELNALDVEVVNIRINSPGGDVFDARAMATAIKGLKAKTVSHIDGVCASAATWIATSCDEVMMADGAFFMIHQAWTVAFGNADDMMSTADLLMKVDDSIVNDYAKKTGASPDQLKQWMEDETWFTAAEALEHGFIDSVFDGEDVDNRWKLDAYENVPENYSGKEQGVAEDEYPRERYERRLALFETAV